MGIRLGIHYHVPALARDGKIWTPGYFGRFVDGVAGCCDTVVCFFHSPIIGEMEMMDSEIHSPNVTLVDLGPHDSIPLRTIRARKIIHIIQNQSQNLDAMLIRGPTPLLPFVYKACNPVPVCLLLVGDYMAGLEAEHQPWWRKIPIRVWSKWNTEQQQQIAKECLTFVNSHRLYTQLEASVPDLIETRTTTLTHADFFEQSDTCQTQPYHLLYTGRMAREKGILDLAKAVGMLRRKGFQVILDLVGPEEKGDNVLTELNALISDLGIQGSILYHGYKQIGVDLFEFYKRADIYLLASRSSFEGFPRTIWEALAHSLPVIATSVGSIPDYLIHKTDALIIPPKRPDLIADAIENLIEDNELRRSIILNGHKLSLDNEISKRSKEMIWQIEKHIRTGGNCED